MLAMIFELLVIAILFGLTAYVLVYLVVCIRNGRRRRNWHSRRCLVFSVPSITERNMNMVRRLTEATRFETHYMNSLARDEILKFHTHIKKSFPKVHSAPFIECTVVDGLSLLYHVRGTDSSLKPYMLCAHLDVWPLGPCDTFPPFEGVDLNCISGSGTKSGKHRLMGIMEALEGLLNLAGFEFRRSIYLAFSHDKETGGEKGARAIGDLLETKKVTMEYILDEGTGIISCKKPAIQAPIALVGVAEKGEMRLKLTVHREIEPLQRRSESPKQILYKALSKLENAVLTEACGPVECKLFRELRMFATPGFFNPVYLYRSKVGEKEFQLYPSTSLEKTYQTISNVTSILRATDEDNYASAKLSVKYIQHDSPAKIYDKVKKLMNDNRIQMNTLSVKAPQGFSSGKSFGCRAIREAIKSTFRTSCAVPVTNITITDSKWYSELSKNIYRFNPVYSRDGFLTPNTSKKERISFLAYLRVCYFFTNLIRISNK